jgi:hypothetical protein
LNFYVGRELYELISDIILLSKLHPCIAKDIFLKGFFGFFITLLLFEGFAVFVIHIWRVGEGI